MVEMGKTTKEFCEDQCMNHITRFINLLMQDKFTKPHITHIAHTSAKNAQYGELEKKLPESLEEYLDKSNIRLYTHQCETIDAVRSGMNVMLCTSTASGKTLSFTLPVLETLSLDPTATALYLSPTKALTQDQLLNLRLMDETLNLSLYPGIYDGDTPPDEKSRVKSRSRFVLSNPFMLNKILPWHHQWTRFYVNLRYVIVDEAHRYRGVFGSNVAQLIRRLRRICAHYGSNPVFILASATPRNPRQFSEALTGLPVRVIENDGSPSGQKFFLMYNPYSGKGQSTDTASKYIFSKAIQQGLQSICFTNSRKMAEIIASETKKDLEKWNPGTGSLVASYRAGYLPEKRRALEAELKSKEKLGIVSTNALELGIDIGSLDVVVMSGYPGTIMSMRQQSGRSGRKQLDSLAVLVAFLSPLDQYFIQHPAELFSSSPESAIIDLKNPYIFENNCLCAATELPLKLERDEAYFGNQLHDFIPRQEQRGNLEKISNSWRYSGKRTAYEIVNLANIRNETFTLTCNGKTIETLDLPQVYREAYKGAIILNQDEKYLVNEVDLENRRIMAVSITSDQLTRPIMNTQVEIVKETETSTKEPIPVSFGIVNINLLITGYQTLVNGQPIAVNQVEMPPLVFTTEAFWFHVPDLVAENLLTFEQFTAGLNGLENAIASIIPFFTMCDRRDIGGANQPSSAAGQPLLFIYDDYEGGIGLSEHAWKQFRAVLQKTYDIVIQCPCKSGCSGCIFSPRLSDNNRDLDKAATKKILERLIEEVNFHLDTERG